MAVNRDKVIASAEKLVAKGKIEPAIKEYERLLDDNPNDVNTLNRIGDLWVRINRTDEAVRVFTRIADHYSRDGFFLKAIAIYKKINKLDPSKLEIYAKLADLYAKQGLAMEAKSQYQILADYHLKHGDPNSALATYRKIADLDPNSINVHVKLADLYSQNGKTEEALKEYDRVGKMLLKRGMLDEAVQVFRKALKIEPRNLDLAESLVTTLIESKDYQNSVQILETSLEANRDNPRLLALLGRTHIARGDLVAAKATLESGLSANPKDPALRELLGEILLKQGRGDAALDVVAPLIDAAVGRGDGRNAVDLLNRILRVDSSNTQALEKLVSVYTKLREETNILGAMNSLAEAHIARKNFDAAAGILRELVRKEPDNAQAREKLAFVQQYATKPPAGTGAAPAPATPASVPPPLSLSDIEEELKVPEDLPQFSIDLDSSEPVDLSFAEPVPEFETAAPFLPGKEPIEEQREDLDFITEHLTEADVFAKYGLTEKAAEHLETVLDRSPKHLGAFERLLKLHLDDGDAEGVARTASAYIRVLRENGDLAAAGAIEQVVVDRGFSLSGGQIEVPTFQAPPDFPVEGISFTSAASDLLLADELAPDFSAAVTAEEETEVEIDLDAIPFEDVPVTAAGAEPLPEETLEEPMAEIPLERVPLERFPPQKIPIEEISLEEITAESVEPFFGMEAEREPDWEERIVPGPSIEELGEIDFYLEQELPDEAQAKLNDLLVRFPNDEQLRLRLDRLDAAAASASVASHPPAAPAPPAERPAAPAGQPPVFSAADIENELLSAIPDDDEGIEIIAPSPRPSAAAGPVADEGNLFADEDDFFDLAAELEEELEEENEEVLSLSEEEQSLEQIFKEFKRGVEQQLDSEDYDTHYNLGIAYKEMGLIDEAIGEFQLASKDPKRTIECCSMLGLCFLEKGMPQLAIRWYRKGLEAPEITEEEHLGLLYDLGSTYMEIGDTANAQKAFMEVYGSNTNYRDIVERIKQVEDAAT